jgi:hypothetical protein
MNKYIMKKRPLFLSVSLLFIIFLSNGCGKPPNLPPDFPKVVPCEITVIQDGKPLEGAMVSLVPVGESGKYAKGCSGRTDAQGIASLMTYGQVGVPFGKYKVLISKNRDEGGKEVDDEYGGKKTVGAKVYAYVDAKYSQEASALFEVEVTDQKTAIMIQCDVGAAIHQYLRDVK